MPLPKISLKINEGIAQAINIDYMKLMNQTPTEKSQYKKNRNRSVIYIFKKVGLMNQIPT
jgi:hypothetical protein